jgi:uncharacterized membrane protein YjgN (DUF898 family)
MNMLVVPPPLPDEPKQVLFTGARDNFRKLVTRGAALEVITAGFYRFWLATDMRRHVWSHTELDGDSFEYTGRARELLIGFLIAMAILMPLYLIYFVIGIYVEQAQAFASFPLFLFFYMFGQFAIYRARRYRLTRTIWRGARFWMDGSGWSYAWRATLWGALVALTLGLAWPWREAALERYKMRHTYYGDLQGSFVGTGWEFFKRGWGLWLASPFMILMIPIPFIYGAFKAIEWKWWVEGLRFGDVSFRSTLRTDALIGRYWAAVGWTTLAYIGIGIYAGAATTLYIQLTGVQLNTLLASGHFLRAAPMLVILGIGYIGMVLVMNVAIRVTLFRDVWQRVVSSVVVSRLDAAANVAAKGELVSALGEGIADGLDVAGF